MLQRLIAALLGLLGVASVGLGVASATAWRADDPLIATAAPGGDVRTLVTDPGVLELAGDPVTVTVRAEGSPVVLAIGRDTDVTGWVGSDPYTRVTGLSDWHTLATTAGEPATDAPSTDPSADAAAATPVPEPSASAPAADGSAATAADPTGSDMWVVETSGDGSASLEWPAQDGRWSLIAVSLGDTAPTLDLSWPQTVTTPWLWPGVALGVLLLAVAAILLVRIVRHRHDGDEAEWHSVATGTFATVTAPPGSLAAAARPGAPGTADGGHAATAPSSTGAAGGEGAGTGASGAVPLGTVTPTTGPLTRRQIREAEAAAAAQRKGRRPGTGAIPVVTGATPVLTGATPVVTGATPVPGPTPVPGSTPTPDGGSAERPPAAPREGGPGPTTSAADRPTGVVPAVAPVAAPGAPSPTDQPVPADETPDAGRRRGLGARMPWSRTPRSATRGPDQPGTPDEPPARTAPATGTASAAGAWAPAPGAAPATSPGSWRPTPQPDQSAPGGAAPARPGGRPAPSAAPSAAPGATAAASAPGGPGAAGDEEASRAQRADAWRRMWGFPADGEPQAEDASTQQGTEEDR
ncbi:hypothetical protein [Cellulomonas sp. NPDC058312]|uniref:hypothetical protein n=1 Tax=Cellulomonas sp. NPDC058312 TaxID=3346441 RepID=UPI0036E04B59